MDDALDVLAWRNDPKSIAVSKSAAAVDQAGHMTWFARAIEDPNRMILIATDGGRKIGMVRFDKSDRGWTVSINMAPDARGKGYGRSALTQAIGILRNEAGVCVIEAEVKDDNLMSLRLFEGTGFIRREFRSGIHILDLR